MSEPVKAHKTNPMLLKSKQEKPITGAPAVEVRISLIAMALIKEQIFCLLHLLQKKPTRFFYAAVKKQAINHSVMAVTISKT
jgi:hypothetical protein